MTWDRQHRLIAAGVAWVRTDIAERAQCRHLATQAIERFGRIDALVNSAFVHGTFPQAVEDAHLDGWRAVFDTNIFGTMTLTQEIVPHMKRQKRGAIVMINTIATRKPFAGESGYAVSKDALAIAAKYLARELAVHGIRANSIHMGWMWGVPPQAYFRQAAAECGMTEEEIIAPVASNLALAKLPTTTTARAAPFLASDYANAVTGATPDANGGDFMP
ncbi:SDR family oxidoreductase [Burkholderia sp. SIMBA_062]|uniref:SDR family oxidoreductase n=1 Tax=Burkholderia sp. SIMBA_062 TaxID=3085803 RepID=UPI00397E7563